MFKNRLAASLTVAALIALSLLTLGQARAAGMVGGDAIATSKGDLHIRPINHATFVMGWNGETIYMDPVGGADVFKGLPAPDLIFITHQHGDHFDVPTLSAVAGA